MGNRAIGQAVKLDEIIQGLGLRDAGGAPADSAVASGAYCSDLLSEVMGGARPGEVWLTIQSHMNLVAVAALKELAAVIVCGGREVDADVAARAAREGVVVLVSPDSMYEVAGRLWEMGLRRAD